MPHSKGACRLEFRHAVTKHDGSQDVMAVQEIIRKEEAVTEGSSTRGGMTIREKGGTTRLTSHHITDASQFGPEWRMFNPRQTGEAFSQEEKFNNRLISDQICKKKHRASADKLSD
jgi:hypothetical protein